jgi:predicted nucleic acid-binding protein
VIDLEVASTVRRLTLLRAISARRGQEVLDDFLELPIRRYPATQLLERIFELRNNLTAYDAAYIALAEALDAPLITTDERLARATGHSAEILSPA